MRALRGRNAKKSAANRRRSVRSVSDLDSSNGINNESSFVSVKTAAMSAGDN